MSISHSTISRYKNKVYKKRKNDVSLKYKDILSTYTPIITGNVVP